MFLKLRDYNLLLNIILWIGNYLSDRFSCVRINGAESREYLAPSGVPQGSHLGPLLFLLFINDLSLVELSGDILLFADDIKLFFEICNVRDCTRLQNDFNKLIDWCMEHLFFLNFKKCFSITFSRRDDFISFDYLVNKNSSCIRVTSIKDLGIILDSELTFNEHITKIIGRGNRIWAFIVHSTRFFTDPASVKHLYISLVKSVLIYASTIWRPNLKVNTARLERVQHKALRHLVCLLIWQPCLIWPWLRCCWWNVWFANNFIIYGCLWHCAHF